MKRWRGAILALSLLAPAAQAQFSLYQTSCIAGQPVGALFSFGSMYPNQAEPETFCLLNTSQSTQTVALLSVNGEGFSIDAAAPMSVKAGSSVNFTITFQGAIVASYSAWLDITGIPQVLLTASVVPALTYEVQLPSGTNVLGATAIDFDSVQVGSNAKLDFLVVNRTASSLTVDPIGVAAGDFALAGPSPSGESVAPQASVSFAIRFSPTVAGARTAVLSIGSQQFTLTGTGVSPPLPAPVAMVTLDTVQSAQQGTIVVDLSEPAESAGSGTVTLSFEAQTAGELDPGIAFSSGGQTAPFTFNQGDTMASFGTGHSVAFQTGTTAGTLVVEAQIGNQVSQQSIVISPAVIGIVAATGTRQTSAVTVDITAFDNTRSASMLTFTFYDSGGNVILPGAINYDSAAAFGSYFAASDDGGQFALSAYFPVNGQPSNVSAFTVQMVNSAGTTTTARESF
jgi:hypothetical protein